MDSLLPGVPSGTLWAAIVGAYTTAIHTIQPGMTHAEQAMSLSILDYRREKWRALGPNQIVTNEPETPQTISSGSRWAKVVL